MSALRALPPRPSLEFEHKQAKALLRRLRAGDAEALTRARARHPAIDASAPGRIRLADTQLVIAREYGFTSWPRLVRYFGDVERQRNAYARQPMHDLGFYEASVRALLVQHRDRRAAAARELAAYVPRFYGMRVDDVFASNITEDDVRLAVARSSGFTNWVMLVERTAAELRRAPDAWEVDPMRYAGKAIAAAALDELKRVIELHPELLHPSDYDAAHGRRLLSSALHHERELGQAAMRPVIDWLVAQGLDLELELNAQLCGHMQITTEKVRWLLYRGADPNWVAPNGIPVLEHALIRYWNGAAVDVLAERAVPRKALWIAAGLGDVDGVRSLLDRGGRPTREARQLLPDFVAMGGRGLPWHPDPDDEQILSDAFIVAMVNARTAVLEYMISRGVPVNTLNYGLPFIFVAVGNGWTSVVECLVRNGANLDLRGRHPDMTAREIAREMFEQNPHDAERRRIIEMCGMDPDAILAELAARPVAPPTVDHKLQETLELAADDALRLGQSDIRPENLLFGLLRGGGLPLMFFTKVSRMDLDRFRADVKDRVHSADDRADGATLPMHPDAQALIDAAIAIATAFRRETVQGLHLLSALTRAEHGAVADLLTRYGSSVATLNVELERAM